MNDINDWIGNEHAKRACDINYNGYQDGAKRCWCHWLKFQNIKEMNKFHKKK